MSNYTRESVLTRFFVSLWYRPTLRLLAQCLSPIGILFFYLAAKRRTQFTQQAKPFTAPVVVVGNITVGGTGKTPVIIELANSFKEQGFSVGIVSRGYGGQAPNYPYEVHQQANTNEVGDEALLIAQATGCPVFIDRDRVAAVQGLLECYPKTQLILSDDGLQHYRLHRDYEIIVVDGTRGLGNGYGLPAGPLREPINRLTEADSVLVNGQPSAKLKKELPDVDVESFQLKPLVWANVAVDSKVQDIPAADENHPWQGEVKAIAAIGNPQRFFDTLTNLGVKFTPVVFDDHHQFTPEDFASFMGDTVVMTSKDAVKCREFAQENWWQLTVACTLPDSVVQSIKNTLKL